MKNRKQCVDFFSKTTLSNDYDYESYPPYIIPCVIRYPENDVRWEANYDLLVYI